MNTPRIIEITSLDAPEVDVYSSLTEPQLRAAREQEQGIFIAESPKVIRVALNAGFTPLSMLCEARHITGDAADIIERCPGLTVYTGQRSVLERLTGYTLTRGVLCAMRRPEARTLNEVCRGARRVAVLHGVVEATNVGAIFRSAAALGIDAVLLTPNSCDPLNRRAIRTSMGAVFVVPWTRLDNLHSLKNLGFTTAAMALSHDAVSLRHPALNEVERMAIVVGNEGDGLPKQTIADADVTITIPMCRGVDSLNVAAAAAIAFYQLATTEHKP